VAQTWVRRLDPANNGLVLDPLSLSLISLNLLPFNHLEKGVKQSKSKSKNTKGQKGTYKLIACPFVAISMQ
jgi:hypothetical protein